MCSMCAHDQCWHMCDGRTRRECLVCLIRPQGMPVGFKNGSNRPQRCLVRWNGRWAPKWGVPRHRNLHCYTKNLASKMQDSKSRSLGRNLIGWIWGATSLGWPACLVVNRFWRQRCQLVKTALALPEPKNGLREVDNLCDLRQ